MERFGCPLPGRDLSIGVDGSVYPCSQAPILRREQRLGRLGSGSLTELLARVPAFAADVPHPPCRRCRAPTNIPRALLSGLMGRA